jgi:Flp pilus assembly protein TadG
MSRSKKLSMRRIRRYLKNREGTAAIEFAILAVPFFMLIFAVLELAIVFFINSTLNHAVSEAGRQIRTGNFQACGTQAQFKQLVCANMSGLGNCEKRLRIDVVSDSSFGAITLAEPPEPPEPDPSDPAATDDIPNGDWENTAASVPVVVRGLYYHKLVLPPQLTRLETMEGKGIRLLSATTAFRNEPFPAPGACPVT